MRKASSVPQRIGFLLPPGLQEAWKDGHVQWLTRLAKGLAARARVLAKIVWETQFTRTKVVLSLAVGRIAPPLEDQVLAMTSQGGCETSTLQAMTTRGLQSEFQIGVQSIDTIVRVVGAFYAQLVLTAQENW